MVRDDKYVEKLVCDFRSMLTCVRVSVRTIHLHLQVFFQIIMQIVDT